MRQGEGRRRIDRYVEQTEDADAGKSLSAYAVDAAVHMPICCDAANGWRRRLRTRHGQAAKQSNEL